MIIKKFSIFLERYYPLLENTGQTYDLKSLPFYQDVTSQGGKIYKVGGSVRDEYIKKPSKDLDLVITNIPIDLLQEILKKTGKVDLVGQSFGVIKYTPPGGQEIDIAIPRTETKSGKGYTGFDVLSDSSLPIEKDLERRDFTINSIAVDSEGNIVDPFSGIKDIETKTIKLTNSKAFSDDPLRMLRAVQFASRFGFQIEPITFAAIQKNRNSISEISKERILIELDKIIKKGDPKLGVELLIETGLYEAIFGREFGGDISNFDKVSRASEFYYFLISPLGGDPGDYYKNVLKGDIATSKEITTLKYIYDNLPLADIHQKRLLLHQINKMCPTILESNLVKEKLGDVLIDFSSGRYPLNISDLQATSQDLMGLGIVGAGIGKAFKDIFSLIYSDKIKNNKKEILDYFSKNMNSSTW